MICGLHSLRPIRRLALDRSGAVLIEAAFALVVLIVMLAGIVTYGLWLMTANSLQQIANEAARATLGAMSAAERDDLVERAISASLLGTGAVDAERVTVATALDGRFFTVTLSYDASANAIFSTSLVPLPSSTIVRSAAVEVGGS